MSIIQYFRLIDTQARMSLKADASEYALGYIWWVLEPLIFVGIFYLVFSIILKTGREDYLMMLLTGNLPFMWFSKTITHSARSIISNVGLIGNTDLPKTMFPMAQIQEGLYKQAIVFALLFVILIGFGYLPTASWFWVIPIIFVNYLLIVSCAFIVSVLVAFMKDIVMFVPLGILFLLFSSGVFWDVRSLPGPRIQDVILTFNPMAFLLDAYRQVLMYGNAPNLMRLFFVGVIFGGIAWLMATWMRKNSKLLALKALTA